MKKLSFECLEHLERLTFDTLATAHASAASGEMVNSTSATAAADINEEECEQVGLSPTAGSGASEGGAFFDMTVM